MSRRQGKRSERRRRWQNPKLSRKHVRQALAFMRKAGLSAGQLADVLKAKAAALFLPKGGHF